MKILSLILILFSSIIAPKIKPIFFAIEAFVIVGSHELPGEGKIISFPKTQQKPNLYTLEVDEIYKGIVTKIFIDYYSDDKAVILHITSRMLQVVTQRGFRIAFTEDNLVKLKKLICGLLSVNKSEMHFSLDLSIGGYRPDKFVIDSSETNTEIRGQDYETKTLRIKKGILYSKKTIIDRPLNADLRFSEYLLKKLAKIK
jgi:hypothetical protein